MTRSTKDPNAPGWFGQLIEFFGMTWPSRDRPPPPIPPTCTACGNPAKRKRKTDPWRCPHHPDADLVDAA